jgi:hypothetical protein
VKLGSLLEKEKRKDYLHFEEMMYLWFERFGGLKDLEEMA